MSWLTPSTTVKSSPLAGAVIITFLTLPPRCWPACSAVRKAPVASMTISTPRESQSNLAGSLSAKIFTSLPSSSKAPSAASTVKGGWPYSESYFNKCANILGSRVLLKATNSNSGCSCTKRTQALPMRPNPLTPTLIVMLFFYLHFQSLRLYSP